MARELRAASFINLDKRAQAIGVSRGWVAVAQDRDVWRRVVAEGSGYCLDNVNEDGTPSVQHICSFLLGRTPHPPGMELLLEDSTE